MAFAHRCFRSSSNVFVWKLLSRIGVCYLILLLPRLSATLTTGEPGPPTISSPPISQKVLSKGKVVFICKVQGNPTPAVYWEKDGKRINPRQYRYLISETSFVSVLSIHPVRFRRDDGVFKCVAGNSLGTVGKDAQLTVYKNINDLRGKYPKITTKPVRAVVRKGGMAVLNCMASGRPEPSYLWLKDNLPVEEDAVITMTTTGSLTIGHTSKNDFGMYQCLARNGIGVAASPAVLLDVQGESSPTPIVSINPQHQRVAEDDRVSFLCKAETDHPSLFHWETSDGTRINPRWNRYLITDRPYMSVLSIDPVKPKKDARQFVCKIYSKNSTLNVTARIEFYNNDSEVPKGYPKISLNPSTISVNETNTAVLECEAAATPEPTFLWLKNQFPVNMSDPRITLLDSGHLQIKNSTGSDTGRYECVSRNEIGVAFSKSAMLYVKVYPGRPVITRAPQDHVVSAGQPVTFTCEASGDPTPTFTWVRNYELVDVEQYHVENNKSTFTIDAVSLNDNNTYVKCTAKNRWGQAWKDARIQVVEKAVPPVFTKMPADVMVKVGTSVTFECAASGQPRPNITWDKEGLDFPAASDRRMHVKPSGDTFYIFETRLEDEGLYICTATNNAGSVSVPARLTILGPPVFTKMPADVMVKVGTSAKFECAASGQPQPSITWDKEGLDFPAASDRRMHAMPSGDTFFIVDTRLEDEGLYICTATNNAGSVTVSARLGVFGSGETRCASHNLSCKLTLDYIYCWVLLNRKRQCQRVFSDQISAETDSIGRYEGKFVIQNFTNGSLRTVMTSGVREKDLPGTPESFNATGISETTVLLSWKLPIPALPHNFIAKYEILYHKVSNPNDVVSLNVTEARIVISGLEINTNYCASVRAFGIYGAGAWSDKLHFNTSGGDRLLREGLPKIRRAPNNHKVISGSKVMFFCEMSSHPAPNLHWEQSDRTIKSSSRYADTITQNISVLVIARVNYPTGTTNFTCVGKNVHGESRASASLYVYSEDDVPVGYPRINIHPRLKGVEKGHAFVLPCQASGIPKPTFLWIKDGLPVDLSDPRLELLNTGYLQITKSKESDEGRYQCVAENEVGVAYSYTAMVYVNALRLPPHFSVLPEDVRVMPGSDVNFTCAAEGNPMPFVKWLDEVHELTDESEVPMGRNILQLKDVTKSQTYTCVASSVLGSIETTARLKVKAPGSPPRNFEAKAFNSTSIIVSWNEPEIPNGIIQGYKLLYTQQPDTPTDSWNVLEVGGGTLELAINDLEQGQTYTLRVLASTTNYGPMSRQIQGTTKEPATDQVHTFLAQVVSANEIEVRWNEPGNSDSISQYVLYYNDTYLLHPGHISFQPTTRKYTLTDLIPDTTYHIQLSTRDQNSNEFRTSTAHAKTESFCPGLPTHIEIERINLTAIHVQWQPPSNSGPTGIIRGYEVYVYEVDENDQTIQSSQPRLYDTFNGTKHDIVITGLVPSRRYSVRVGAYTRKGGGVRSRPEFTEQDCNEEINSQMHKNGSIQSLFYPNSYPAGSTCTYTFVGNQQERVQLEFVHMDLVFDGGDRNDPISCDGFDSVKVMIPLDGKQVELIRLCGKKLPPVLMSAGNQMTVVFHSKPSPGRGSTGFKAVYNFVTNFGITTGDQFKEGECIFKYYSGASLEGSFSTPNYPGLYPRNTECHYMFFGKRDEKVHITFTDFDLEGIKPRCDDATQSDYVSFSNYVLLTVEDRKFSRLCGSLIDGRSESRTSDATFFHVTFKSNDLYDSSGFRAQYQFKSPGPPGSPPRNVRARAASSTTIVVSWNEPEIPNGIIQGYKVFYTLQPEKPIFFWDVQDVTNDNQLDTISGLKPNETYTISTLAYSGIGQGPMSHPIQVLTTQGVPYQPLNLHADPISANEIEVMWDAPQEEASIKSYELYYNDSYFRQNIRISIKPPVEKYKLTDLTPDTLYHIQVSATSSRGEGPKTPTIQAKTKPFIPGEPRKVRVEAINSTAIFVEWRPPTENERNGIIRGYQVYFYEVDSNDESIPGMTPRFSDTFDGTKHEAVITGLDPETRYNVKVAAYTRKDDGIRSKPKVITTKGAVPSPPRNLHVDLIQEDPPRVKVTWHRPRETHGPIENYKIIWGRIGQHYEENILPSKKYSFVTYLLDKGTTYEFRVSAKNDYDYGERSVENIKTPDGAPAGAPQNFTCTGLSETSVRLTWDLPARALRNGDIAMYQITYHKLSEPISEGDLNVTDTYVDISGLEMNTDYRFKIKAYTSKGSGPWSNNLHFHTFGRMPPAPRNVKIRRTSSSIIEVTWDEPDFPVAGYKIYYNMFATPDMEVWQTLETGPYTVAEITGLEQHTVYAVRVQARSVDNRCGNLSEMVTTDFIPPFPGEPRKVRVEAINSTAIFVEWRPPTKKERNGIIRGYQVYFYEVDSNDESIPGTTPRFSDTFDGTKHEAVITGLDPETRYNVKVAAYTRKGDGIRSKPRVITTKGAVPSPPRNLYVHLIQEDPPMVKVTWHRPRETHGPIENYKIIWGRIGQHYEENILPSKKYSFVTYLLDKGTTYEFRVSAKNDYDYGEPSVENIKTPDGAPAGAPQNFTCTGLSETSVRLTWDLPARALRNGDIAMYQITYHKLSEPISEGDLNVTDTYVDISGLEMNTDYRFKIKAYTSKGSGPWSNNLHFHTFGRMPPAPRNVKIRRTSSSIIEVTWDEPDFPVAGYKIYYNMFATPDMEVWQTLETGPYTVAEITGLEQHRVYAVRVQARSVDDRYGNLSRIVTTDFIPPFPGRPRKVRVEAINSTAIFVEWRPPTEKGRNGIIRGYQVYFYEVDSNGESIPGTTPRFSDTFDGTKHEAVITGLDPETRYNVKVAAYTRKGDGIRSKPRVITTKGAAPSPPRNLHVDLIQEDPPRVKVTWHRPRETHGPIENYKIIWGRIGQHYEEKILPSKKYSFVTHLLDKGTTYEFRVSAKNDYDYGERSVENIKTPDGAPAGAPQNFTCTGLSETSVRLTWDLPARALRNGNIAMYQITYHKLLDLISEADLNVTDTYVDISGLEMNTDYRFKIKAYTSKGSGPWSNNLHFRTFGRIRRDVVKNFRVTLRTSNMMKLSWDKPQKPGVNSYLLKYEGVKNYWENGVIKQIYQAKEEVRIAGQMTTWSLPNLQPKMKFDFTISVIFQDSTAGEDQHIIVETLIEAPPSVRRPELDRIAHGKITLRLTRASERNGPISYYYLIVVPQLRKDHYIEKKPQDFTLEMLTEGVEKSASSPYIAARFDPHDLPSYFDLGDGQSYGGFHNHILDSDARYKVFLRAYTVDIRLHTSSAYSKLLSLSTGEI